ncbi:MAG: signal peptidase I [Mycobacteriales bacterium]
MSRIVGRVGANAPELPERYRGRHRSAGYRAQAGTPVRWFRRLPVWQEVPLLIILALAMSLFVRTFVIESFFIPSGSMERTLLIGDRVMVNKLVYDVRNPRRGEIIVFRGSESWAPEQRVKPPGNLVDTIKLKLGEVVGLGGPNEKDFIKRVIGLPGDTVGCCDSAGRYTVNGHGVNEPYIFENLPLEQRGFGPIKVPKGRLFVMGDHRGNSKDSRAYLDDGHSGTIPRGNVIGRAFVRVWPHDRLGLLSAPKVFDHVGKAVKPAPAPSNTPISDPMLGGPMRQTLGSVVVLAYRGRRGRRLPE